MKIDRSYYWNETARRKIWILADLETRTAVHLWIAGKPDNFYGGVEVHRSTCPMWRDSDKPDHEHCWILNGPCWHDGSSLAAGRAIESYHNGFLDDDAAWNYLTRYLVDAVNESKEDGR